MFDADSATSDVRQRLRDQVAALASDDTAENLDEAMLKSCATPAVFVFVRRSSASELSPGLQTQKVELEILVGVVTQSGAGRSAALKGSSGLMTIVGGVEKALHWWKPTWVLERIKFRGEGEPMRVGSRLGSQLHFAASVYESYT